MAGRKKNKSQDIKTKLFARSTAQLEKSLEGFKAIPDPEKVPFDIEDWAGSSPEHTINGVLYKDLMEEEKQKDENTE